MESGMWWEETGRKWSESEEVFVRYVTIEKERWM